MLGTILSGQGSIGRSFSVCQSEMLIWVQCFNIYIVVVAKKHPDMVPEMLAYMLIVLRAQHEYEETAWCLYDEAFRDKATATGNKSKIVSN